MLWPEIRLWYRKSESPECCVSAEGALDKPGLSFNYNNATDRCRVFLTNFVVDTANYTGVMRLDSSPFRSRGYLLATEEQVVFWVGAKGKIQRLKTEKEKQKRIKGVGH